MHRYFPHTDSDIQEMLKVCGLSSLDDLYSEVPEEIRFKGEYDIPEAMSELELRRHFSEMGAKNRLLTCFAGAGCYDHYTPSIIPSLIQRSEYLTSYTPYQAEISQGTLHYIFEFQTMMSRLTGLPVSNASMYDGATATAEAAMMMMATAKKADCVLVSATMDPKVRRVIDTYAHFHGFAVKTIAAENGATSAASLQALLAEGGAAGAIVQQPNCFGIIEDFTGFADACHEQKALLAINSVIADLALLKTPGEWNADIAMGDGQSLGIPMSFGGPSVGYMCCTEKLMRKMPGRIVGQTLDTKGQRCYVLTLQAREQHIRRQKATSNICSNQSLMALFVTIYCSVMGKEGLKEAARLSYAGAHYLAEQLCKAEGGAFRLKYDRPFFNEFCVEYSGDLDARIQQCIDAGVLPGVKTDDNTLMIAVTEKRSKQEVDNLINLLTQ
ncbi:MAG: aminomethyl-transferring glycine dehydrogenase subunit GcvPA [Bacteroidaceae bacterium]|nr:aminomethyl-transferring glycine dehydrogenase subunit GcvPA [Bacteroidaceae bacterium]